MGYVSISKMMDDDHIDNTLRDYGFGNISNVRIKEIIDSTARILGEKHRHKQSDLTLDHLMQSLVRVVWVDI